MAPVVIEPLRVSVQFSAAYKPTPSEMTLAAMGSETTSVASPAFHTQKNIRG